MRHISKAAGNVYNKIRYQGSSDKFTEILFAWPRIVGDRLSKNTWPQKIVTRATIDNTELLSLYIMVKTFQDREKIIFIQGVIKEKIKMRCKCNIDSVIVHNIALERKNIR